MPIELYIMVVVWLLIDLVCRFMLNRNLYQLYMKKEMGMLQGIIYLSFLLIYLKLRHIVRPRTRCKHKARMKYVTDLSCEEVMEKLRQEAHNDFQFIKEKEDVKDNMYILSIDWKAPLYQKYLRAGARYRVLVTPSQTGSTVWFYLSECSDDYALDQFAERLRGFMEEKIGAFREE